MSKTYECSICYHVNHVAKLHCSACGTTPSMYSVLRVPMSQVWGLTGNISTVAAIGVSRAERHCYARVNLRTVPADYYAS